jgi:hypothetical protein
MPNKWNLDGVSVDINDNMTVTGNLAVTGTTTATGALTASGGVAVTGTVVADGDVSGSDFVGETFTTRNAPTGSGGIVIHNKTNSVDITAATSVDIDMNIPAGALILGTQLIVTSALAGGDTWNALYKTGATQVIAGSTAVAKNTKVNQMFDANAATAITSGVTDITIDCDGAGSFTAQGTIRAITYYLDFSTIADWA